MLVSYRISRSIEWCANRMMGLRHYYFRRAGSVKRDFREHCLGTCCSGTETAFPNRRNMGKACCVSFSGTVGNRRPIGYSILQSKRSSEAEMSSSMRFSRKNQQLSGNFSRINESTRWISRRNKQEPSSLLWGERPPNQKKGRYDRGGGAEGST